MTRIMVIMRDVHEIHEQAFAELEKGVQKLGLDEPVEQEYIYELGKTYATDVGPALIAVAQIGNTFLLYSPEYMTKRQQIIFDFLLGGVDEDITIKVMNARDYDAVKNCHDLGRRVKVSMIP